MAYITKINVQDSEYDLKDTKARNLIAELNKLINANIDLYSYGVEWDVTKSTPECTRIGNPLLHKSLPILSAYRGCIAQGNSIEYYLDPNDWHYKEGVIPKVIDNVTVAITNDTLGTLTLPELETLDNGVYVKIDNVWGLITNTSTGITIQFEENVYDKKTTLAGTKSITIGANLSGYDGTVRVHIPRFYGKSGSEGNKRWVRTSTIKIDDTWMEIPEMLVDAYRCTILRNKPTDWGYLSGLEAGSTISVVNTQKFCRGGTTNTGNDHLTSTNSAINLDTHLTTDLNRTLLGKPATNIPRANMRGYAKLANNSELLCYEFYKWIFCWNYIIEYANFNSLAGYVAALTSDGYHKGGLGAGVTNMSLWNEYNGNNPLTPCGYGNKFGNFTEIEGLKIPSFDYTKYAAYVKDYTVTDAITATTSGNKKNITAIKSTEKGAFSVNLTSAWGTITYTITGLTDGLSVIFKLGGTGYSDATVVTPTVNGNDYTVTWANYNEGGTKYIGFSKTLAECNITISNTRSTKTLSSAVLTLKMPRWRGFDNPFGDIWTNLDGIVLKRDKKGEASKVYTTTNASKFDDTSANKTETDIAGIEIATDGYIKEFDLGERGEIIPSAVGAKESTYKCDNHWCNNTSTVDRLLIVGGGALYGGLAGLLCFHSGSGVANALSHIGFRTLIRK